MLEWLKRLFHRPAAPVVPAVKYLTPEYVEALIEEAGRAEVFALARINGWDTYSAPPLWVWAGLAREVLMRNSLPPTVH